ncbi:GNAT family N-acetyltransferase [Dyella silvatica]|uniref:GNAT family N-acetyltransferase n=1 Tax=Dyella silvatica TaxID=2992128 RepID=UPI0022518ADA|nr:GNAT family N-acetyltransferase [Dyella silvatica]
MPDSTMGQMTRQIPELETARLRLRAHRADDFETCLAIWSSPEVTRFIGGRPFNAEEVWDRLMRYAGFWSLLGFGYWAVEEKDSGRYIGDIGFTDLKRDIEPRLDGMLEFGWVLAPQAHGKGYASEVVAAVIDWGQAHFTDRRAVCIISPDNLASIRVAEKAGFQRLQETTYHGKPTVIFSR